MKPFALCGICIYNTLPILTKAKCLPKIVQKFKHHENVSKCLWWESETIHPGYFRKGYMVRELQVLLHLLHQLVEFACLEPLLTFPRVM